MKNYYFFLILWLFSGIVKSHSQNLVPNHSFEEYIKCPPNNMLSSDLSVYVKDWFTPDFHLGTPDYFHVCANSIPNVPIYGGTQYPKSGNAYVGFFPGGMDIDAREYLMAKLISQPIKGEKYTLIIYVSLHDATSSVNGLGMALLSDNDFNAVRTTIKSHKFINGISPQLMSTQVITDNINWVKLETEYTATGDEEYIMIGGFIPNNLINKIGTGNPYYFLDDILVMKTSEYLAIQEIEKKSFSVYPNPTSDLINIESENEIVKSIEINDVNGRLIPLNNINNQTIDISSFANGTYFLKINSNTGEEVHKVIKK